MRSVCRTAKLKPEGLVDGIWQDFQAIDEAIASPGPIPQTPPADAPTYRAVARALRYQQNSYLVLETTDIQHIFDSVDVWFIRACCQLIDSVTQDHALRRAMQVKEDFLLNITHSLRTPIVCECLAIALF
jgi:signal transduction histidine kinase